MLQTDKRPTGPSLVRRSLVSLRSFGPVIGPTSTGIMVAGAAGSGLVLLIWAVALVLLSVDLSTGAALIAPMGATAVILFALPNSPLAQPWSAVVGNSVSALMALWVHQVVDDPALAVGASAFLALLAMLVTRSLHPPGGAVALTASLNPHMLDESGFDFVLFPVLCGTIGLVCAAMLWHRLIGRTYPFRQPHVAEAKSGTDQHAHLLPGLDAEDLADILATYRQSANLGVEDLARLIAAAEQVAADHSRQQETRR